MNLLANRCSGVRRGVDGRSSSEDKVLFFRQLFAGRAHAQLRAVRIGDRDARSDLPVVWLGRLFGREGEFRLERLAVPLRSTDLLHFQPLPRESSLPG